MCTVTSKNIWCYFNFMKRVTVYTHIYIEIYRYILHFLLCKESCRLDLISKHSGFGPYQHVVNKYSVGSLMKASPVRIFHGHLYFISWQYLQSLSGGLSLDRVICMTCIPWHSQYSEMAFLVLFSTIWNMLPILAVSIAWELDICHEQPSSGTPPVHLDWTYQPVLYPYR